MILITVLRLAAQFYVIVLIADWLLETTSFSVAPRVRDWVSRCAAPPLMWVRSRAAPSWSGADMAHPVALALLLLVQAVLGLS